MEVVINIPDKTYNEIFEMCNYNGITVDEYIFNCTLDNYNLMKYADLNEKLNKEVETKVEEKPQEIVEKKKVGRPKKKKEEEIKVEKTEVPSVKVIPQEVKVEEKPTTIKRTRILKTK